MQQKLTHEWVERDYCEIIPVHKGHLGKEIPARYSKKGTHSHHAKNLLSVHEAIPDHRSNDRSFAHQPQLNSQSALIHHERHLSRMGTSQRPAVNFLNHTKVNHCISSQGRSQEGGCFETKCWSKAQSRMGTAPSGHNRKFIISDFVRVTNGPHISRDASACLEMNPKLYSKCKNYFTPF